MILLHLGLIKYFPKPKPLNSVTYLICNYITKYVVARRAGAHELMKERITVTIDKDLLEWLDERIKDKVFANRSHGFEFLIKKRMKEEDKSEK